MKALKIPNETELRKLMLAEVEKIHTHGMTYKGETRFLSAEQYRQIIKGVTENKPKFDFSKRGSFSRFRNPDNQFLIASAENPMGSKKSKSYNAKKTSAFRKFLDEQGISYTPQEGKYGGTPENSQLIDIRSSADTKAIDSWLEKHSPQEENILIREGMAVRYDPRTKVAFFVDLKTLTKGKKSLRVADDAGDFYSKIAGRKYALPLYNENFEKLMSEVEFNNFFNK